MNKLTIYKRDFQFFQKDFQTNFQSQAESKQCISFCFLVALSRVRFFVRSLPYGS